MSYVGNLIRPPSEADALILQVTVGCPHNRCTLCGAYQEIVAQARQGEHPLVAGCWRAL